MPYRCMRPRGHRLLTNRVCSFIVAILYERKWAEARKPIHRFLNRVPLQMSSRRRKTTKTMPRLSLRKRVVLMLENLGPRLAHRWNTLLVPDNLSSSNFSLSSADRPDSRHVLLNRSLIRYVLEEKKKKRKIRRKILRNRLYTIFIEI